MSKVHLNVQDQTGIKPNTFQNFPSQEEQDYCCHFWKKRTAPSEVLGYISIPIFFINIEAFMLLHIPSFSL